MPIENNHDGVEGHSNHKAAKESHKPSQWTRPFDFFRGAIELGEKYQDKYDEHGRRILPPYSQLIVCALLIVALFGWLYEVEYLNSERTVALFTALLTIIAVVQFGSSVFQWRAMSEQNKIMLDQMKQTNEIIEQNRLEQRAWLGAVDPVIQLIPNQPTVTSVNVKNSGRTPGTVTHAAFGVQIQQADDDIAPFVNMVHQFQHPELRESVVPPDVTWRFHVRKSIVLNEPAIAALNDGQLAFYVVGQFFYTDVFGKNHTTQCCFRYRPGDKGLLAYDKYNYMD